MPDPRLTAPDPDSSAPPSATVARPPSEPVAAAAPEPDPSSETRPAPESDPVADSAYDLESGPELFNETGSGIDDDSGPDPDRESSEFEIANTTRTLAPGLYLVATPIGNLEDITLRALRVLKTADRIACEDTRQTQKLLNHFDIHTPTVSCHEYNEAQRTPELLAELRAGRRIAVVSDAGMPGISDPGMHLAAAAIAAGIAVYPIPGANAALTALVASGLNATTFRYQGFLPSKSGARRAQLQRLAQADSALAGHSSAHPATARPTTLVFYESPHRILETLADIEFVWGPACPVVVARELTKLHEEFLRGTVSDIRRDLAARDRIRGEMTLLVSPATQPPQDQAAAAPISIRARIAALAQSEGLGEMDALKRIARERGISKSEAYRELQRERARP